MYERLRNSIAAHISLTEAEFGYFTSLLTLRHLEKRDRLLVPGQICGFEGFVDAGCLRMFFTDFRGDEHVLSFAPEGWWVADIGSFLSQEPSVFCIDALERSDVLLIDKVSKDALYARLPTFERLFRIMTQRAHVSLQHRLIAGMHQHAQERYVEFTEQYPALVQRLPQHQIAAYLGICPEFLCRIKRRLADTAQDGMARATRHDQTASPAVRATITASLPSHRPRSTTS